MGDNNTKWEPVVYSDVCAWALDRSGYSFERAVPERTLPTEPDIYWSPSERLYYELSSDGSWWIPSWTWVSTDRVPSDLVRLVPVTEVEEAEKRIHAAREYVADPANWSGLDGRRRMILSLLDGEAAS